MNCLQEAPAEAGAANRSGKIEARWPIGLLKQSWSTHGAWPLTILLQHQDAIGGAVARSLGAGRQELDLNEYCRNSNKESSLAFFTASTFEPWPTLKTIGAAKIESNQTISNKNKCSIALFNTEWMHP